MKLKKNIFNKKNLPHIILLAVLFCIFLFSFLIFNIGKTTSRKVFIFPSVEHEKFVVEYRNLSKQPVQGEIQYYIDELLLGSTIERTKLLFNPNTKVLSCFQRGKVLYLNLSSDLLNMGYGVIDIKSAVDLLSKNIKKNFSRVDKVEVFVNGKIAFDN